MTILVERTKIYYLPHCSVCDGDPYKCDNCGCSFNLNPNDEQYDGEVHCIRFHGKRSRKGSLHTCSKECTESLLAKKKEKGEILRTEYKRSHLLCLFDEEDAVK